MRVLNKGGKQLDFQIIMLLITFVISIIIALIIIPILKKLKIGQIERVDGPQSHLSKQGTPTMGGVIILLAMILATIAVFIYYSNRDVELIKNMIPLLIMAVGTGIIGFIDDFKKLILKDTKGLKPSYKMLGLLIISVIYVLYLIKFSNINTEILIPFTKIYINFPIWLYIPFSVFVILGTTNAVNLTDGVDGLGGSVAVIITATLTVFATILGIQEVVIFGSIICGAVLGFLIFNIHPAKVFMGDTGSLMLGGIISAMAIYLKMPLILLIIALVPILETLSVIIQVTYYKKTKKRIFKMAPLHHHFELSGWSENKVVSVFSIVTTILCVIGIYAI